MRSQRWKVIVSLAAANAAVILALVVVSTRASAQNSAPRASEARARGDYTMVSGKINSGGPSVVYLVDSSNQEIIALRWDQTKQIMNGVGYRSIALDARGGRGR